MKKTSILKLVVIAIIAIALVFVSTKVFADDGILDLSNTLQGGTSTDENTNQNTNEGLLGTNTNNPLDNVTSADNQNTNNNNTSTYPESDIPHAGIETSMLAVAAFIVCAIIGLYTFMKLSDYSNI